MPKIAYYEHDKEKLIKVKDLIIFLDDLIEEDNLDKQSLLALKSFFKRMSKS